MTDPSDPHPAPDPATPDSLPAALLSQVTGEPHRLRALLAAIVESSEDGIVSKTLEGIVTYWNKSAERMFGYTAQEMLGQSILKIIPQELHPEEQRILDQLRQGHRIERYETIRLHKSGTKLHISLTISPVRSAAGQIVGAAKIAHDVTALRQREEDLQHVAAEREQLLVSEREARNAAERLSQLKDEFLATLSHELRTPLNAIQGWVNILRMPNVGPADVARGIETIERNARAQAQIVADLLDMSRIVSGRMLLEVRPMHLQDVIQNALEGVRPSADSKSIRIHMMLDSKVGTVRGDPTRLQQVLWNLLANAIKFTPKEGRIKVTLERVNSHVEIAIEDNGVGIDASFLPFVFDRFRQADPGISRKYGGLGIGLSIVKSLVELHGGSVRVKSAGMSQGATFIVSLPLYNVVSEEIPAPKLAFDPLDKLKLPTLDGARVLLVDDDIDGCDVIARILGAHGASARCVHDAEQALSAIQQESYDIVLSDIGLPVIDGYELMQRVRALNSPVRRIPAIAITAYARPEDRQRALLAGFQMHMAKPLEAAELVAAVASLRTLAAPP
ncbi:MAG TPA: ATP-binding protein [Steroidobacteraceae bacterium]|jgi:PAS domain S-box-containing protein|nr:ATP-binding protein [Steroidobacteraceae bacterium]